MSNLCDNFQGPLIPTDCYGPVTSILLSIVGIYRSILGAVGLLSHPNSEIHEEGESRIMTDPSHEKYIQAFYDTTYRYVLLSLLAFLLLEISAHVIRCLVGALRFVCCSSCPSQADNLDHLGPS